MGTALLDLGDKRSRSVLSASHPWLSGEMVASAGPTSSCSGVRNHPGNVTQSLAARQCCWSQVSFCQRLTGGEFAVGWAFSNAGASRYRQGS